ADLPELADDNRHDREARTKAAKALNVSPRLVQNAKRVVEQGVPELADAVRRGEVAVDAAAEVAKLPQEEQREVVQQGRDAIKARAKTARESSKPPPRNVSSHSPFDDEEDDLPDIPTDGAFEVSDAVWDPENF